MSSVLDPNANKDDKALQSTAVTTVPGTAAPGSGTGSTAAPGSNASATAGSPSTQQGSGRFTNIQKYLTANQGGADRLANTVGSGLQGDIQNKQNQASNYYNKLGESVQKANEVGQQGAQYNTQLQGIGNQIKANSITATPTPGATPTVSPEDQAKFNAWQKGTADFSAINNFAQAPNQSIQQYQDILAGRAVNQNLLNNQQKMAAQNINNAAQAAQTAQQNLGSENGRYQLLQKQFGGPVSPNYNQGLQRLDQVILGQGGGLGKVQANINNQARDVQQLQGNINQAGNDVSRIATQQSGLRTDLGNQSNANEQAYIDMLKGYVNPLNQQRDQEFNDLNTATQSYIPKYDAKGNKINTPYTPGFTDEQMSRLNLNDKNQGVYNVFKDITDANAFVDKGQAAQGAKDVAQQADVNRYQALARMMGTQPVNPQLTQASTLGASYTNKADNQDLASRLTAAQGQFDSLANATNQVTGRVGGSYDTGYHNTYNDILNKGLNPSVYLTGSIQAPGSTAGNPSYIPHEFLAADNNSGYSKSALNQSKNNFINFINDQNYNQTIGGRRNTWLDTEAANNSTKNNGTPKLNNTPITGEDPNLAYLRNLNTTSGKG